MVFECIICFNSLEEAADLSQIPGAKRLKVEEDQVLVVAPCGHLFHHVCHEGWVTEHRTCPYESCKEIACNPHVKVIHPEINNDKETAQENEIKKLKRQLEELQAKCQSSNGLGRELLNSKSSTTWYNIRGTYELLCSRNFKAYLEALDVKTDTNFVRPNKIQEIIHKVARKSTSRPIPIHKPNRWGREMAIIKSSVNHQKEFAIKTIYYYDDKFHRTTLNFKVGRAFKASFEGISSESQKQEELGIAKTVLTLESPFVMKQVQTYKTKKNKRICVTIWREFNCSGLMKVTMEHPSSFKPCVRIYEKVRPGQRRLKEQSSCREVSSDDDSDNDPGSSDSSGSEEEDINNDKE